MLVAKYDPKVKYYICPLCGDWTDSLGCEICEVLYDKVEKKEDVRVYTPD